VGNLGRRWGGGEGKILHNSSGEFMPRQTRQLPRAVDLKGGLCFLLW
jgi:hypothetical protein